MDQAQDSNAGTCADRTQSRRCHHRDSSARRGGSLKGIVFNQFIMDEISVATHGELLCCWRGVETVTLVGDPKQLAATVLTTKDTNPFFQIQSYGPFQRWSELGMPVFLLKEVMRMTAGLEDISNTIFYDSKLVRGPGTSLDDPKREMSCLLRPMIQKLLPKLISEPDGLVYPVFFDVRGVCYKEENGSSRVNYQNIAFIIDWMKKLLSKISLGLRSSDFGIACPYSGQRREMRKALVKARFGDVPVGTTEYWQGKEAKLTIVDLVRARNDNDSLGFLVKKERLNVLLARQQQHHFRRWRYHLP